MADPLLNDCEVDTATPVASTEEAAAAAASVENNQTSCSRHSPTTAAASVYSAAAKHLMEKNNLLHEAERFITFTDAVVAIAMTLLILPLMERASDIGEEGSEAKTASDFYSENGSRIGSLAVAFFVVAYVWRVHDRIFVYVGYFPKYLLQLTFVWMAGIVFVPVSASMSIQCQQDDVIGNVTYLGNLTCIAIINLLMCILIRNDKRTWKFDHPPGMLSVVENGITVTTMLLAILVTVLVPKIGSSTALFLIASDKFTFLAKKLRPDWSY